jgi:hypothetical protein
VPKYDRQVQDWERSGGVAKTAERNLAPDARVDYQLEDPSRPDVLDGVGCPPQKTQHFI